jgi:hypothetical protein
VTSVARPELTKPRDPLRLTPSTALVCSLHDPHGSVRPRPPSREPRGTDATVDLVITRPLTLSDYKGRPCNFVPEQAVAASRRCDVAASRLLDE